MFQSRSKEEVKELLAYILIGKGREGLEDYYKRLIKGLYEEGGDTPEVRAQHDICIEAIAEVLTEEKAV